MNSTHSYHSSSISFPNPFQLLIQQIGDRVAQLLSTPRKHKGIPALLRMLRRHGSLQFELLEERSYASPSYVLRKVGVEPSYLALSRDSSCTVFDAYRASEGLWEKGSSGLDLHFQTEDREELSQQKLQANHIQAYVDQYLIVNCMTEKGMRQRIYTLCQKGA